MARRTLGLLTCAALAFVPARASAQRPVGLLPQWEARADVVVAPQLGGESFGIVLAEAMAAGAAVVASDLPAFRRLLGDGRHGVVAPRGDVAAWSRALGDLLDDPARRATLGRRARAAVAPLDWRQVTSTVLAVYAETVAARSGSLVSPEAPSARRL